MLKIILLVLIAEICTAFGQILFKKSTNSLDIHNLHSVEGVKKFLAKVLVKPLIWTGMISMGFGLVIWIVALAQGDLSIVYPIGSLQYVIILFSAHMLLNEKIDRMKFIGTFLVVFGIILITMS